jgi:hypothetical protein
MLQVFTVSTFSSFLETVLGRFEDSCRAIEEIELLKII